MTLEYLYNVYNFCCRGDAARRPEARMAQHPGSDAEGLPPYGAGGVGGECLYHTDINRYNKFGED